MPAATGHCQRSVAARERRLSSWIGDAECQNNLPLCNDRDLAGVSCYSRSSTPMERGEGSQARAREW
jgi:hypothetical protein